uniref:Teleost multiple tissue opsin b n=1 Tax=Cynoglossus semilaevis TaxID=244447 RepID=A0A3P8WPP5_CYNSE
MILCNESLNCVQCGGGGVTLPPLSLTPSGHLVVALCLGFIGTLGFLSNFLVLTLFCRYRTLRTPMNLLLVSISFSDLLVCVLGTPFSFAASTQGRWLIGRVGCVWYGFVNSCLGIFSLIILAVISYERYCTMMAPTIADGRDFRPALGGICFSCLYSVVWTVPPLLGWSRYGPEGPGTTCSVDWKTQTLNNVSYIVCLFVFCLLLPFCVILHSYGKLLLAIRQVRSSVVARRREERVLVMVVIMVSCYLVCWLPYGVVALISTFGSSDLVTPEVSIAPSLLAKFSTVINPFIYIFMNKQFYRCFLALLNCSNPELSSNMKTFSRPTITLRTFHQEKKHHVSPQAPPSALPTPSSGHRSSRHAADPASPSNQSCNSSHPPSENGHTPKVILVAHYRE